MRRSSIRGLIILLFLGGVLSACQAGILQPSVPPTPPVPPVPPGPTPGPAPVVNAVDGTRATFAFAEPTGGASAYYLCAGNDPNAICNSEIIPPPQCTSGVCTFTILGLKADEIYDYIIGYKDNSGVASYKTAFQANTAWKIVRYDSTEPNQGLGTRISEAGDVNADGFPDVLVGGGGLSPTGVTDLFLGGAGNSFLDAGGNLVPHTLFSGDELTHGHAFALVDVTDDGIDDVIIGQYVYNLDFFGRVFIYSGRANWQAQYIASGGAGNQSTYIITDNEVNAWFGWTLAAGDINGDGHNDLVIGTPQPGTAPGRVYWKAGPIASDLVLVPGDILKSGTLIADHVGYYVYSIGDPDQDNMAEVMFARRVDNPAPGTEQITWMISDDLVTELGPYGGLSDESVVGPLALLNGFYLSTGIAGGGQARIFVNNARLASTFDLINNTDAGFGSALAYGDFHITDVVNELVVASQGGIFEYDAATLPPDATPDGSLPETTRAMLFMDINGDWYPDGVMGDPWANAGNGRVTIYY